MIRSVTQQSVIRNVLKSVLSNARKAALHQYTSQKGLGNQKLDWIFAPFVKTVSLRAR